MHNKLCGRPPQYAPAPCKLTFDLESGVRVMCDMGYLCANFSLPVVLGLSVLDSGPVYATDRRQTESDVRCQTDVRCASSLNAPAMGAEA